MAKDRDISAEIAKESDPAKRQSLLKEREQKINALQSQGVDTGKWASNDIVSTWEGSYTPGGYVKETGKYNPYGVNKVTSEEGIARLYAAAEQQKLEALKRAKAENIRKFRQEMPRIDQQYDSVQKDLQANAKMSALGNAEKVAAMGLGGNAYTDPTSGYSESGRVSMDNELRRGLNDSNIARQNAKRAIEEAIIESNAKLDIESVRELAEMKMKQIEDVLNEFNTNRKYDMQLGEIMGYINGNQTQSGRLAKEKASEQKLKREYDEAMERWRITRVVQPQDAKVLGVSPGTKYNR